ARRLAADRSTREFNVLDQSRAMENQLVWVAANQTGRRGPLRFPGQSKVVDPTGAVLACTGTHPGMAIASIDARAAATAARGRLSHLADRRPAAYGPEPAGPDATEPSPAGPTLALAGNG
ncbi:MAG: carbon-nitrogen hydrolase family protein, partial [Actinomycetota bacterium]|nr:carbon-nitrogen hydrolase family protein [Actinomycetota bacterium]